MNGEPLSLEHGYPLRLLVPGWYGMASVKWLKEIALLTARFAGQFQTEEYIFQNEPGIENGHPVTAMWVRSLILAPQDKEILEKNPVEISGIAWSGEGEIAGVEISVDGGENWQAAQLERAISAYGFRRWRFRWQPEKPGSCTLASRATDSSGKTQPMQPRGNTLGYGNNVIHQINVNVA
jgi:DMSO/TMAO reductase YedYZ molybdopterin-dependent catalytic subunit